MPRASLAPPVAVRAALIQRTYPTIGWTLVEIVGIAKVVLTPFLTFPFARAPWLSLELLADRT